MRVIVVTSGKGGVGKTTTSAAFASGLALRGFKTAVIDFDVGLRNLDLIMGCERRVVYDLVNVVNGEARLNQALIKDKHCDNLFILPASQTRDKDALTEDGVGKVLEELEHMGFEYVVCDSPAGIERGAVMALTFADEAIVTTNPEVSSVRDRKERRGPYAWRRVELEDPGARDEAVLRLKKTLNAGFAVPIDWYPAFDSMRMPAGSFHAPVRGEGGWHASLAHDYEIELPGGRVLAAGTPVTDAALLRETLAPTSTIKFLRMKNSWGREIGPLGARGYTDAMWDYLMWEFSRARIDYDEKKVEGIALGAVVLPPPSWDGATH